MPARDRDAVGRKHEALRTELIESGELLNGAGLAYPADTTTMRLADGAVATTARGIRSAADRVLPDRLR
jgi:hypothetical protein